MNMVQKRGFASLTSREGGAILPLGKIAAFVFLAFTFVCFLSASAGAQVSVLTQHADTERDGVYSNETHLTPTSTIHKLFTMSLDDQVMGQALVLGGLSVTGYPTNVLLVSTSSPEGAGVTSAWAFNADTGAKLWQLSLGTNASFTTSTPVVDPTLGPHGALFVVTKSSSSNTNELHAIDVLAGTELTGSPVTISASAGGDSFDSAQENARTALLDINGTIYTSYCHMTDSGTYHGWLIAYKYTTGSGFSQNGVWCDTCSGGNQGGIWQGGDGVIYDGTSIFVATGNGTIGGGNYGMSIVQLSPSNLGTVESSYLPPNAQGNSNGDADLNGGGMVIMPGTGGKIFIGPTKYGALYLVNDADLGAAAINTYSTNGTVGHSPIAWNSGSAQYAYVWPSGTAIQQYCYTGGSTGSGPCEQSTFTAGGTLAISSTPTGANAILWAYGGSELHAMNPANVSAADYWNSNQTTGDSTGSGPGNFQYIAVANGKVYVPSGNNLIAYGSPVVVNCTTAPSAPSNLSATAVSSSQINLGWTASTAGSGCSITYNVYQSTTSGFTPSAANQVASGVTGTNYSAAGLTASTTYYYVVEAVDSSGSSAASNQASAETEAAGAVTEVVAIASGGPAQSNASGGDYSFVADEDFVGGGINGKTTATINLTQPGANAAPMAVYQNGRNGTITYTIPGLTPGSSYTVLLHFAETYFTAAGDREFNVAINGTSVLTNFDILGTVGAENAALVEIFTARANSSGQILIAFTSGAVNQPLVMGIEVRTISGASCAAVPSAPTGLTATASSSSVIGLTWTAVTPPTNCTISSYSVYRSTTSGFTPSSSTLVASGLTSPSYSNTGLAASTTYYFIVEALDSYGTSAASAQAQATTLSGGSGGDFIAINCEGPAVNNSGGGDASFAADEDFTGGGASTPTTHSISTTAAGANAAPMAVYQTQRDGTFTYTIPGMVANSQHTVLIHFAEIYFTAAGDREFNVAINGTPVLTNFDQFAAAGGEYIAVVKSFTATANSSGQIVVAFTSGAVNQPSVAGLEIR
jgi:hypothetical protein